MRSGATTRVAPTKRRLCRGRPPCLPPLACRNHIAKVLTTKPNTYPTTNKTAPQRHPHCQKTPTHDQYHTPTPNTTTAHTQHTPNHTPHTQTTHAQPTNPDLPAPPTHTALQKPDPLTPATNPTKHNSPQPTASTHRRQARIGRLPRWSVIALRVDAPQGMPAHRHYPRNQPLGIQFPHTPALCNLWGLRCAARPTTPPNVVSLQVSGWMLAKLRGVRVCGWVGCGGLVWGVW